MGADGEYATSVSKVYGRRGSRWPDGRPLYSGFTTVLPPNASSCGWDARDREWATCLPTKFHRGGGERVRGGCFAHCMRDTIDTGNLAQKELVKDAGTVPSELGSSGNDSGRRGHRPRGVLAVCRLSEIA